MSCSNAYPPVIRHPSHGLVKSQVSIVVVYYVQRSERFHAVAQKNKIRKSKAERKSRLKNSRNLNLSGKPTGPKAVAAYSRECIAGV
jgi:hypothetical protein